MFTWLCHIPSKVIAYERPKTFQDFVAQETGKFGVNAVLLSKVIRCESRGNIHAVGDHGLAKGILQFHEPTFYAYAKKAGISKPDIWNPEQQVTVASYMFSKGQSGQWTCTAMVS